MRKFFVLTITLIFFTIFFVSPIKAQEIVSREDLNFDEGLSDKEFDTYGYIDSISVVSIQGGQSSVFSDGQQWVKGLYYYMITHMGFLDIPFHYIVTWQGDILQGRGGKYEVNSIANYEVGVDYNNTLLIAYFDNGRGLTNQGKDALDSLVGKASVSFSVDLENIFIGDFTVNISEEGQPSVLDITLSTDDYLLAWLDIFKKGTLPTEGLGLELSGEVGEVTYDESVTSWGDINMTVLVKNTGDYPWYNSGTNATYLATSSPRSHNSDFYNPEGWSSFSRVVTSTEEIVMPGETATFQFVARAPITEDTYTEKFELIRLPKSWVDDTQVSMTVTVSQGNLQLVEIRETGTGFLTVRECGHPNCKQISAVETGYVTILRAEKVGWSQIVYDGVNEGWVFGEYVKKL